MFTSVKKHDLYLVFEAALVSLFCATLLASFYQLFLTPATPSYLTIGLINLILGLAAHTWLSKTGAIDLKNQAQESSVLVEKLSKVRLVGLPWDRAITLLLGFGVVLIAIISNSLPDAERRPTVNLDIDWYYFAAIMVLIPIAEEILFRGVIGSLMRRRYGVVLGIYFSAICFAFLHSMPTMMSWQSFQVGLPLGPLLLGLICEVMVYFRGSLWIAMIFHGVANGSVLVFEVFDSRWLKWLGFLYI
jgi:membrane protease YdiL (CAAX protease family)